MTTRQSFAKAVCVGAISLGAIAALTAEPGYAHSSTTRVPWIDAAEDTTNVGKQLDYVRQWWHGRNLASYGYIPDNDCANFASQTLIARGWQMSDEWFSTRTAQWSGDEADGGWDYDASTAWVSSTALYGYLSSLPDRARPLDDGQRDEVKPGDIVQFNWSTNDAAAAGSERDHTGVVTGVEKSSTGTTVLYAAHTQGITPDPDGPTKSVESYSVDQARVDRGGGIVSYWSILTP